MSRLVCLVVLLCVVAPVHAFGTQAPQEYSGSSTRQAGTTTNLFQSLDPQSPIHGAQLELPPDWSAEDIRLFRYGTNPVPVQHRSGPDDTVVFTTSSPIQGPHELVLRVRTSTQPGPHRWHLTPFVFEDASERPGSPIRQLRNADRLTQRVELEPPPRPDDSNRALDLNGAQSPVLFQLPESHAPGSDRSFTIEFWMRTSGLNQVPLSSWTGEETAPYPFEFIVDRSGRLRLYCGQARTHEALRTKRPVADGQWHHVAAVYDDASSHLHLLLDGLRVDSLRPEAMPPLSSSLPVSLGGRPGSTTKASREVQYTGRLDEVRFWPTARPFSTLRRMRRQPFAAHRSSTSSQPFRLSFEDESDPEPNTWPEGAEQVPSNLTFRSPLRGLRAETDGASVTLRWTAQQTDQGTFVVERSSNGRSFTPVERLSPIDIGPQSAKDAQEIVYTDENVPGNVVYYRIRQTSPPSNAERTTSTIKIGLGDDDPPSETTELIGNFPNPFKTSTTITYRVENSQRISLTVWDLSGKQIATLVDEVHEPGYYEEPMRAADLPSGPYFVRLETPRDIQSHRMILLK